MKKFLVVLILSALPAFCFADSAILNGFFAATQGDWSGQGVVVIQGLNGPAATKNINVTRSTVAQGANSWAVTTQMSGPNFKPSNSVASYVISDDGLQETTGAHDDSAEIIISTEQALEISTSHSDPVTGKTVTTTKNINFISTKQIHMITDLYQGQNLVQHFDYVLTKN
jgi:hypothetical protein